MKSIFNNNSNCLSDSDNDQYKLQSVANFAKSRKLHYEKYVSKRKDTRTSNGIAVEPTGEVVSSLES